MLRRTSPAVILALCLSTALVSQDTPKLYDLTTTAKKGTTAWFRWSRTATQEHADDGTALMHIERTYRVTIKQVTKSNGRIIELQIARAKGSLELSNQPKITFDTALKDKGNSDSANASMIEMFTAGVGKPFVARVDKTGKLAGSVTGVAHEMSGDAALSQYDLLQLVESAFGKLPGDPVPVDGTWQAGFDTNGVKLQETATLKKVDPATFTTSLTGTVVKGDAPTGPELQKHQIEFYESMKVSNGTSTGKQRISRRDGLVEVATHRQTCTVELTIADQTAKSKNLLVTRLRRIAAPGSSPLDEARVAKAMADTKILADQVRTFYIRNGKLPGTLAVLAKKDARGRSYLAELPNDAWGNAYKLVLGDTPRKFLVRSAGPDGKHGTEDDISSSDSR